MSGSKKMGRPANPQRVMVRAMFKDWSDRRFDTYWSGFTMLSSLVLEGYLTHDEKMALDQKIMDRIIRPNGTFSVARYERECADEYLKVVQAYDPGHDEGPGGGTGALTSAPPSASTSDREDA